VEVVSFVAVYTVWTVLKV